MTAPTPARPPAAPAAPRRLTTPGGLALAQSIELEALLRRWYVAGIGALFGVALLVVALAVWRANVVQWVEHTNAVLRHAYVVRTLAADREASVRGFVATGDSSLLKTEVDARTRLPLVLDSLHHLTADNPAQQARVRAIRDLVSRWSASVAVDSEGIARFDSVRDDVGDFLSVEQNLHRQRARLELITRWVSSGILVLAIGLLALVLRRFETAVRRQAGSLRTQQMQLEEQAVELSYQLDQLHDQATELETTNSELERTNAELEEQIAATERSERAAASAREAWQAVGRRLAFVLESSPLAIAILEPDGRVEMANPAFAAIAGGPAEVIGRTLGESMPEYAAVLGPLVAGVFAGREPTVDVEIVAAAPPRPRAPLGLPPADGGAGGAPGARRVWSASVYPIRSDGHVVGVGIALLEVTERRQLEEQYRHAQRMEAVGRLTGGIAHDFNNLLTVITGFGELVAVKLSDGVLREDMAQVLGAAERATALTRQLLAFSRRQVLQPVPLDLNALATSVAPLLGKLVGADVDVALRLAPHVGQVLADPGQIEQILMNLVVNARDAMPDGGSIMIETRDVQLDDEYVRRHPGSARGPHTLLAVTDSGVGMDEATRARVFEPFFTTKPQGKGTGLGLSTVYGIVKQSGGGVEIYSELGHGTTVRVYLPHHVGEATRATSAPAPVELPDQSATILLVEDDESVAAMAMRVLGDHQYTVLRAPNGQAALGLAETHDGPIDLVITDLVMPEMGGRVLAERLAAVRPDARVLFMSGYTAEAVNQRAVLPSDAAFLEKPFRPAVLLSVVRRLLRAGPVARHANRV